MDQRNFRYPVKKSNSAKRSGRNSVRALTPKQSARALAESEGRFRAVVEQSIAAIFVIQDEKIVYVNPRMRQLFGYAPGDTFDPNPLAHVKETDWLKVEEQMQRRLHGEASAAYTITALHKDGSEFLFGINATRAVFQRKPATIAVGQDITDKAAAEENTRRYVELLKQGMHSTIEAISIISEMRDPYTHGHERRVGEIAAAAAIAGEMGLDANRIEGLRIAGYLHDVGKISVPAELLAKPSKLTSAEFELVKTHAQQSYEILKGVDFPWPVAQVALQHHERIDGSGYPQRLKGDAIILEARIMAVAAVIEAMASHRPYRPGLGIDKALTEIERGRGSVYDSDVSDACLRLFRDKGYSIPA